MKKILENGITMIDWFCKECPINNHQDCGPWGDTDKELFSQIKQTHENHQGWQIYDEEKIYEEKIKYFDQDFMNSFADGIRTDRFNQMIDDFTFTISEENKEITFIPLENEIKKLQPLSVYDDVAWMLVFLPVKGKVVTTKGTEKNPIIKTEYFQTNYPYYINSKKELIVTKEKWLNEQFQLPDLGLGENVRWKPIDLANFIESDEKVNLKILFDTILNQIKSLIELKDKDSLKVLTLWAIGTYFYRLFEYYPYLDFSGSKGSGKTKALVILLCICYNARLSHKITGPNWARNVDALNCTILIDEQEDLNKPESEHAKNLILLLNSAFRTDANQSISVPIKDMGWGSKTFDLGVPVALGHISPLNDVTEDRAIPLKMIHSIDKKILDAEVEQNNPIWNRIRDMTYRSYLDYFDEVIKIKKEVITLPNITSRERNQIWKPLITLAKLFERHGVTGLEESITNVIKDTHELRNLSNQSSNLDIQILEKLCELFITKQISEPKDSSILKNWYRQSIILEKITTEEGSELAGISSKQLGNSLDRLQIQRRKKNPYNMCAYFDRQILINLCKRYDLEYQALLAQSALQSHNSNEQSATSAQCAQSAKIDSQEFSAQSAKSAESLDTDIAHIEHKEDK